MTPRKGPGLLQAGARGAAHGVSAGEAALTSLACCHG
jgi:hypothetical protein